MAVLLRGRVKAFSYREQGGEALLAVRGAERCWARSPRSTGCPGRRRSPRSNRCGRSPSRRTSSWRSCRPTAASPSSSCGCSASAGATRTASASSSACSTRPGAWRSASSSWPSGSACPTSAGRARTPGRERPDHAQPVAGGAGGLGRRVPRGGQQGAAHAAPARLDRDGAAAPHRPRPPGAPPARALTRCAARAAVTRTLCRMQLQQLAYFVAVAEVRHFTQAAELLRVAQPSLSKQIRALENELNVSLFSRARGTSR